MMACSAHTLRSSFLNQVPCCLYCTPLSQGWTRYGLIWALYMYYKLIKPSRKPCLAEIPITLSLILMRAPFLMFFCHLRSFRLVLSSVCTCALCVCDPTEKQTHHSVGLAEK